jgi:biotin operon repressor
MLEFKAYVKKHHQKNLFSGSEFDILDSKNSNLIQLADFIVGSIGHIFDETKKSEFSDKLLQILKPINSGLNFFPKEYSFEEIEKSNTDDNFDPLIAKVCLMRINDFIDKTKADDQQKSDQVNFLKLLLLFQRVYFKSKYISTNEIFKHLNKTRTGNLKEEYFRSKVVGNLRDKGILISSSRSGYKIPTNKKDLESFIKHGNRIIIPMINRINKMRNAIKLATTNDLDLLDNFDELKKIIE